MAGTTLDRDKLNAFLERYQKQSLLRFLTCGSVDDGKSTLIGRMLHDAGQVYEDQLAAADAESKRRGFEEVDLSFLVDGLEAEREQGITIDVAYRYFATPKRKFIIADTPGHVQYTRNMVTGASNCDLAIILVDAQHGISEQTRRHAFLTSLLGIRHVVLAVNKMDLVDWSEDVYEQIRADGADMAARLEARDLHFIPVSARLGDNVVHRSERMPWYQGKPLLDLLETVHVGSDRNFIDLRLFVQYVARLEGGKRGYCGMLSSGVLRPGDEVVAMPSGRGSKVEKILCGGEPVQEAVPPMSVMVTLTDQVDISRGDCLAHPGNVPRLTHGVEAMVVWMDESAVLKPGGSLMLKHGTTKTSASLSSIAYRIDVETLRRAPANELALNEIGRCTLDTTRPLAVDAYAKNRGAGSFILIDRLTNRTVGCGMIVDRRDAASGGGTFGRERADARTDGGGNVRRQQSLVPVEARAKRLAQHPFTLWLTGLPRSGKSSIAYALEAKLFGDGRTVQVLDGENLRHGLSKDLGFSGGDRWEHQRRAAEVAKLLNDAGLIAVVALVSPLAADRDTARRIVGEERFVEVFCDAPLEVCEGRDVDGLYAAARAGEVAGVTGVDAPYEVPGDAALRLDTAGVEVDGNVARVVEALRGRGLLED